MKKMNSYSDKPLLEIAKILSKKERKVTLDGDNLQINDIVSISDTSTSVSLTLDKKRRNKIKQSYEHMIEDIKNGVPIYGCNTGFGARASRVVTEGTADERMKMAKKISEGIIHVDVTVGPPFSSAITRSAIGIRVNMLMKGVSAVKVEDLEKYVQLLNAGITPIVGQYGGIGASGDLAHNCRVLSALRQIDGTKVIDRSGKVREAKFALRKAGIEALKLDPKAGLAFVNGDNFSTAVASHLAVDTLKALIISFVLSALVIEILKGTDRSFHPLLGSVRPHQGQREVADIFRDLLSGSKLAYQEMKGHQVRPSGVKVQDGYSLRCISQYQGVNVEKLKRIFDTITTNANSVSDNPLWVNPNETAEGEKPWQWVSGGNFIAMHMVDVMDELRKILTQITKLNDRHLARMVSPHENNGLPPNLSGKKAITHCTFKGIQIQSGMFDVYSSLLSMPVSTFFGFHEEGNQDITSHALTSGILGLENLRITQYSLAQNLIAVSQAVDLRGGRKLLAKKTRPLYDFVRKHVDFIDTEEPMGTKIENIYQKIQSGYLYDHLLRHF